MTDRFFDIKASGGDHADIASWLAELDNSPHVSGDHSYGELWDENFDESVTISGGGTVGLIGWTLRAEATQRHDGTAGNGARMVRTAAATPLTLSSANTVDMNVEFIDIDLNGNAAAQALTMGGGSGVQQNVRWCIVHGASGGFGTGWGLMSTGGGRKHDIIRNIVYDMTNVAGGSQQQNGIWLANTSTSNLIGNTVFDIVANTSTGVANCFKIADDADHTVTNNIGCDPSGSSSGAKVCVEPSTFSNATVSYFLTSDDTGSGTGSIGADDGVVTADEFVSISGSIDLHLKAGADAIDAGTDLLETPTGVNIDIDGTDVHASGVAWDIGAHEYVAAGGGGPPPGQINSRGRLGAQQIDGGQIQ